MHVQQIIRASADILTITSLSPGNVYKRIEEPDYSGEQRLSFGVVQSVMNNGEDAAVTALELAPDYSGIVAKLRVFDGRKPVAIFPATPEEVSVHLSELLDRATRDVASAEEALNTKREALARVQRVSDTIGELTAPESVARELDPA